MACWDSGKVWRLRGRRNICAARVISTAKAETQTSVCNYSPTTVAAHSGPSQNQHTCNVEAAADGKRSHCAAHLVPLSCWSELLPDGHLVGQMSKAVSTLRCSGDRTHQCVRMCALVHSVAKLLLRNEADANEAL